MILSDGKNQYPNNEFHFWEWSAPILQSPEEVIETWNKLKLKDRVVKNIFSVGMGYNWRDDDINEAVYNALENLHPLVRAKIPNPDAFLPQGIVIPCFAEIDEPLLIEFEDGDVLGISFSEGSCVRIELNTIPLMINPGTNPRTFHANRLFQNMIGKRLAAIEVTALTEKPELTGSYGLTLNEQVSYIERVDIVYDDFDLNP